jgi:elongation factor G
MVYDGKMHSVDSNDISFKLAGAHAFKEAFLNANPKLLEPTRRLMVKVPEDMVGNVMTDLQSRRSVIQGIENTDNFQVLNCITPESELFGFSTELRSLTKGKATFSSEFIEYKPVPANIQKSLLN